MMQSNSVCKDYSKSKVGGFLRHSVDGALCESSVIPFLVPRRKVWLTSAAGVPCSNAGNIGERKTWTHSEFCTSQISVKDAKVPGICVYIYIVYQ